MIERLMAERWRTVLGGAAILLGIGLLVAGWIGVSGNPDVAHQIPYLTSGGIGGLVAVALGGLMIGLEAAHGVARRLDRLEEALDEVRIRESANHGGAEAGAVTPAKVLRPPLLLAARNGKMYHGPACTLLVGKTNLRRLGTSEIDREALTPCGLCLPDVAAAMREVSVVEQGELLNS